MPELLPSKERELSELDEIALDLKAKIKRFEKKLKDAQNRIVKFKQTAEKTSQYFLQGMGAARAERKKQFEDFIHSIIAACQSDYFSSDDKCILRDYVMELIGYFGPPDNPFPAWFSCAVPEPASLDIAEPADNEALHDSDDDFDDFDFADHSEEFRERMKEEADLWHNGRSCAKITESKELRKLYYNLARRIHPDKASSPAMRVRYTQLMSEVNRAYEIGDAARLFKLEEELEEYLLAEAHHSSSLLNSSRLEAVESLKRKAKLLQDQFESAKVELKLLKNTEVGGTIKEVEAAKKRGEDPLQMCIRDLDHECLCIRKLKSDIEQLLRNRRRNSKFSRKLIEGVQQSVFASHLVMGDMEDFFEEAFENFFMAMAANEGKRGKVWSKK